MKQSIFLSPPGADLFNSVFQDQLRKSIDEQIADFENSLAVIVKTPNLVAVNSGTSALHLAIKAIGVNKGDEVICPTFTFAATIFPILYERAKPVFIDSEMSTWNMDPKLLEKVLAEKAKKNVLPKAIVVAHIYGMPAQMDPITQLANHYKVPIIEDAAEAFGSRYNGQMVGTFGDIGIFSFNNNKVVTSLGGGSIVSENASFIDKCRYWAAQSKDDRPFYHHKEVGYNYRISSLNASLGYSQLKLHEKLISKRIQTFNFYKTNLLETKGFNSSDPSHGYFSNRWLSTFLVDPVIAKISAKEIIDRLKKNGIEARPLWKPMHRQPVFKNFECFNNGVAEQLFTKGFCLPSGPGLNQNDLTRIVNVVTNEN